MHIYILLINPLIPRREIQGTKSSSSGYFAISIHSSHEGRYSTPCSWHQYNGRNFNPLIPRREIQQYCTKIGCHILAVLQKTYLFSLSAAPKTLKIPRISRKNNLYPGANPPRFLCELPVRTRMILAIHSHLSHSYHITSFINDTFTIPKRS